MYFFYRLADRLFPDIIELGLMALVVLVPPLLLAVGLWKWWTRRNKTDPRA